MNLKFYKKSYMEKYDVVVVGSGNAALCAALSARDNGAKKVLIIEKENIRLVGEKDGGRVCNMERRLMR